MRKSRILTVFFAFLAGTCFADTHIWDGGSASSPNWTASANWVNNSLPSAGDFLIFPSGSARLSNVNTFGSYTSFQGIIIQGDNYDISGNPLTLTNHLTAEIGAQSNTFRPVIRLGAGIYIRTLGSGQQLKLLGNIELNGYDLSLLSKGELECGGVISGAGDVTSTGNGRTIFSGIFSNTYTGHTYVFDGFLELRKFLVVMPGNLRFGRTAVPGNLNIGLDTSALISDAVICSASNQIGNNSQVFIRSTGELNLGGYSDTILFLKMRGGHATTGAGTLTVTGNVVCEEGGNGSVISGNFNLGTIATVFTVQQDALLTIGAVISGGTGAGLIKEDAGELRLYASNTYNGITILNGGTTRVAVTGGLGSGSTGVTMGGGKLLLSNASISGKTLTVNGGSLSSTSSSSAWVGDIQLNSPLTYIDTAGASTLVLTGVISGVGSFRKYGTGTLRMAGTTPNTFTGTSRIHDGVLELYKFFNQQHVPSIVADLTVGDYGGEILRYGGPGQLGDSARLIVDSAGTVEMQGWPDAVGALSGAGEVDLGSGGSLTVGGNDTPATFSGEIAGDGDLVKTGTSTFVLSGVNTYTGNTLIEEGTLLVDGSIGAGSVVQVRPGGTLGGDGEVHSISVFAGGTVAPGASPGHLTASTVNFPTGDLEIEINGAVAGSQYDRLTAGGPVILGGGLSVIPGYAPGPGAKFLILDNSTAGAISGIFNGLPEGSTMPIGGRLFELSYVGGDGNDVELSHVVAGPASITDVYVGTEGVITVIGVGQPELNYTVEATDNLSDGAEWFSIATAQADGVGAFELIDKHSLSNPGRCYRITSP